MATADYVIVGAGSAGCVLANRLSEDPETRVLLIEAGGTDRHPNIKIPAAFANQFHTKLDWDYYTEPEPHVDGRSLYIPRGKSLGGSSSMNAMLYVRGRPLDYDLWVRAGRSRLGLGRRPALLPSLRGQRPRRLGVPRRRRRAAGRASSARRGRSTGACSMPASPPGSRGSTTTTGPSRTASRCSRSRRSNGRRWSAADALPAPGAAPAEPRAGRPAPPCSASSSRASARSASATARRRGGAKLARAEREVILCAGRDRLAADPDAVGHRPARRPARARGRAAPRAARGRAKPPGPPVRDRCSGRSRSERDALRRRQAQVPRRVAAAPQRPADLDRRRGGRLRPHPARPARRRHPVPHGRRSTSRSTATRGVRRRRDDDRAGAGQPRVARLGAGCARPTRLAKPRILTNSLAEPDDVDSLVAGMELAREIAAQEPLARSIVRELKPGRGGRARGTRSRPTCAGA